EVEELRDAAVRDEYVARLYVAMDDEVLMRIVNRRANLLKELQPFSGCEHLLVAVLADGPAFYIFHDKIGSPLSCGAAVHQTSDVGMVQACKDLTFVQET